MSTRRSLLREGRKRAAERGLSSEELQRLHEEGGQAAMRGLPQNSCRYKDPEKVNAWVRGWIEADGKSTVLTDAEIQTGRARMAEIRALLNMGKSDRG